LRSPVKRIKKYEEKISGWEGLEVVHTGYKFMRNLMLLNYWLSQLYYQECDLLAKRLCEENNLDVVECERLHIMLRKCCSETERRLDYCLEALNECKARFRNWVKCEEVKDRVKELYDSLEVWKLGLSYGVRCGIVTSWNIAPLTKVIVVESRIGGAYE